MNDAKASSCSACNSESSHKPAQKWTCGFCTLENHSGAPKCEACQRPSQSRNFPRNARGDFTRSSSTDDHKQSWPPRLPEARGWASIGGVEKKAVACRACKQQGHNRTSATAANCPAFYDPKEVDLRRQKKEKAIQKAKEAKEDVAKLQQDLDSETRTGQDLLVEMQRLVAEQQRQAESRQAESSRTIKESELKNVVRRRPHVPKNVPGNSAENESMFWNR